MRRLVFLALVVSVLLLSTSVEAQWWRWGRPKAGGGTATSSNNDSLPLLTDFDSNFTYVGAFRLPSSGVTPEWYTIALTDNDSTMWLGDYVNVTKIDIPALVNDATLSNLNTATIHSGYSWQEFWTPAAAEIGQSNGFAVTSLLQSGSNLIMQGHRMYDGDDQAVESTWKVPAATALASQFPADIDALWDCSGSGRTNCQGFVSQFMGNIPSHWQSDLGGPAFAGSGNCSSIVTRQSMGLGFFVFDPANVGTGGTIPAIPLAYHQQAHWNWGSYDQVVSPFIINTYAWGPNSCAGNINIIPNTRTLLMLGSTSEDYTLHYCYGPPTSDPALEGHQDPQYGYPYCYDPESGNEGPHSYPYKYAWWMVDLLHLKAAKLGTENVWDALPYAFGTLTLPYYTSTQHRLKSAVYNPNNQYLYIAREQTDGGLTKIAIVQVFHFVGPH